MKKYLKLAVLLGLVAAAILVVTNTASAGGRNIVGAWYVDTCGAPFAPHAMIFHDDNTVQITNPDAAEATNSSSAGYGEWRRQGNAVVGQFVEVNADKATNKPTTNLKVKFTLTVTSSSFSGPAKATYFNPLGVPIPGLVDLPAFLYAQRITVDSGAPMAKNCPDIAPETDRPGKVTVHHADSQLVPLMSPIIAPIGMITIHDPADWSDTGYTFDLHGLPSGTCIPIGGAWNDRTSSVMFNGINYYDYVTLYENTGCGGHVISTPSGGQPWKTCNAGISTYYGPWYNGYVHPFSYCQDLASSMWVVKVSAW